MSAQHFNNETAGVQHLTLPLVRQQVAKLLDEAPSAINDDEDLTDRGLDSIRIMSLAEKWRGMGIDITFMRLIKTPRISSWWRLLSSSN